MYRLLLKTETRGTEAVPRMLLRDLFFRNLLFKFLRKIFLMPILLESEAINCKIEHPALKLIM